MLTWIELTNFQKHVDLRHDFSEGLNLIVGPNWAGKSSLLRAVRYALFGSSAAKVKADNLAGPQGSAWNVRLGFRLHAADYTVERGPRKALLLNGEEIRASGHAAVTSEIESMIGAQAAFMAYQVALQGEADTLLTLGVTKLTQHIESVIGSDVVDRVLERLRAVRAPLAAVNEAQTVEWSSRLLTAQETHREKHALALSQYAELTELAQRIPSLAALLTASQAELASLEQQASAYAQREREREQLSARREQLAEVLLLAETRLACSVQGEDPAQVFTELQELSEQARTRQEAAANLDKANAAAETAQRALDDSFRVSASEIEQAQLKAGQAKAQLQEASERLAIAAADRDAHRMMLSGAACPTCRRPFDGHDPSALEVSLRASEALHAELVEQVLHFKHAAKGSEHSATTLAEQLRQREAWRVRRDKASDEARQLGEQLANLPLVDPADLQGLTSRYHVASQAQAELSHARSTVADRRQELEQVEGQLAALPSLDAVSDEQLIEAKRVCAECGQGLSQAKLEDAALRERYAALTETLGVLATEIADLQEKLEAAGKTRARIALLDRLAKYLRANRDRFTAHAWNSILSFASSFASRASGGDLEALVRLEDGRFAYQEAGRVRDIELASGMQTSILGVGLKLALAAAVNSPFAVLLFDEVSAAASEENALRMTQELAASGSQILLVSHRDSDAAAASSVIYL